jgi:hypothetical protein
MWVTTHAFSMCEGHVIGNVFFVIFWFYCRWSPKNTNYVKWYLRVGGIWVHASHSNSIEVQVSPLCHDGIFGLHVVVLNVQGFPEAQTAVEF